VVWVMPKETLHHVYLSVRRGLARVVSKIVPPHEIDDIVQETYVRLCQVASSESIKHPKSYLFQTARNLALDSVRRADNRLTEPLETAQEGWSTAPTSDDVLDRIISNEEFGQFCEAVRHLPPQARRVFLLKKVYGYSQREIAAELGLAESTVEKHVALAIRRCKDFMEEQVTTQRGDQKSKRGGQ
jgi:RNA polymerase sigma factor (sigma-70 family)